MVLRVQAIQYKIITEDEGGFGLEWIDFQRKSVDIGLYDFIAGKEEQPTEFDPPGESLKSTRYKRSVIGLC